MQGLLQQALLSSTKALNIRRQGLDLAEQSTMYIKGKLESRGSTTEREYDTSVWKITNERSRAWSGTFRLSCAQVGRIAERLKIYGVAIDAYNRLLEEVMTKSATVEDGNIGRTQNIDENIEELSRRIESLKIVASAEAVSKPIVALQLSADKDNR